MLCTCVDYSLVSYFNFNHMYPLHTEVTEFPLLLQRRKDSGREIRHVVILKSAGGGGGVW
jgi:hypothetical protein